jgi:hypothetical protein
LTMNNAVFLDLTFGSCKNRRFGETYASIVVVERIGEIATPNDGDDKFLRNRFLQEAHPILSQKTGFLKNSHYFINMLKRLTVRINNITSQLASIVSYC